MSIRDLLATLMVAGSALMAATGCTASVSAYVLHSEPPPPREELVTYRPGFFWVHGHWERGPDRWHWDTGHWERERAGYIWGEGRWERRGQRFEWINGGWRARA